MSYQTKSQNLVPNPSFENYTLPPTPTSNNPINLMGYHWIVRLNDPFWSPSRFTDPVNHVSNWFRANQATPDYYHLNAFPRKINITLPLATTLGVGIPQNWGQEVDLQPPSEGNAYAGIKIERYPDKALTTPGDLDYHEYLAVKLNSILESNQTYIVKFKYAIAEYEDEDIKTNANVKGRVSNEYYLKNLGVGFASNTGFLDYPTYASYWWDRPTGGYYTRNLPAGLERTEMSNLPYAAPGEWQEFEAYFSTPNSTLEYLILGNFQQRIPLADIGQISQNSQLPNDLRLYNFYFFIDDVEVRKVVTGNCRCDNIFVCPHIRKEELEESPSHPNTCCFETPIIPAPTSCEFQSVRIMLNGVPVTDPPIINYGHIVKYPEQVSATFCIPKTDGEEVTTIQYQFLDVNGTVLCVLSGEAKCNCACVEAKDFIADGASEKVIEHSIVKIGNENGKCCWEYSLINNYSCNFKNTFELVVDDLGVGTTFTAIAPWTETIQGGKHVFSSPDGLQYRTLQATGFTSKVFKICTEPQTSQYPPEIKAEFRKNGDNTQCRVFADKLECKASENCCDKLNIDLKRGSAASGSECRFDLIISHKNSLSKCDIYGIRVKSSTGTVLHTTTTGSILNLDKPTLIWGDDLGVCPFGYGSGYLSSATYTIEILGENGIVLCSVQKTFECCPKSTISSQKAIVQDEKPILLSTGGLLTHVIVESGILRYTLSNNGDAISANIRLMSLSGEVLLQHEIKLAKGSSSIGDFDVSQLASGSYYLVVQTDSWLTSRQVIIIR